MPPASEQTQPLIASARARSHYPESSIRELSIAGLLALISAIVLWPFRDYSALFPDEGIALQGAIRILEGQVLYRDFFAFYTPGSYYLLAFLFKIFGPSYIVARTLLPVYGAVFSLLTYLLARRVCSRPVSAMTAWLFLMAGIPHRAFVLHNWDSAVTAALALYFAILWLEKRTPALAFSLGTFTALTALFEQSKGAGLLLGLVLGWVLLAWRGELRTRWRAAQWGAAAVGLAWPVATTLIYFASLGSLSAAISGWVWPLKHYSQANRLPYGYINVGMEGWEKLYGSGPWFERLLNVLFTLPCFVVPVLPFLAGLYLVVHLRRGCRDGESSQASASPYYVLVSSVVLGLTLSAISTGRPEFDHLVYLGPPLFLVLGWAVSAQGLNSWLLPRMAPLLTTLFLVFFTSFGLSFYIGGPIRAKERFETPRGTVRLGFPDKVLGYLLSHARPGDSIFVYPYQPIYYFFSATRNPTRHEYLQLGMHTREQMREVLNDLAGRPPRFILFAPSFNYETIPRSWPATPQEVIASDPIRDFLLANYRLCRPLAAEHWRHYLMVKKGSECPGEAGFEPGLNSSLPKCTSLAGF